MIRLTQGDVYPAIRFRIVSNGDPVDLTGATLTTKIRGPGGVVKSFANGKHTLAASQGGAGMGYFDLALDDADTADLLDTSSWPENEGLEIVTKVVQGSSEISYRKKNILRVDPADPVAPKRA